MFWDASHLNPATSTFAYENVLKPMFGIGQRDEAALLAAEPRFQAAARILEAALADRPWICGATMTLADLSLGASFMFATASQLPWGGYPNLRAWYGRLDETAAWTATRPSLG
jgi:glutathione S-transferase